MEFKDDMQLADLVLDKIQSYVEQYESYRYNVSIHGMSLIVDLSAVSFMQTLQKRIIDRGFMEPHNQD